MIDNDPMLSRVADNLFWMSRYLERAENTARLLDVHMNSTLDMASGLVEKQRVQRLLGSLSVPLDTVEDTDVLRSLTLDINNAASIIALVASARDNARQVREQLSSEMWMQLNKLYLHVRGPQASVAWESAPHDFYLDVRNGSHLFQGITDATMTHNQGWHFIQIGRYIERGIALLTLLDVHFQQRHLKPNDNISIDHYFELVETLKSVTAFEAYTKVYSPNVQAISIIEFLLFNSEFPRSLRFCVNEIQDSLNALADMTGYSANSRLHRLAGRLQSNLSYDEIADIPTLHDYLANIKQRIYQIHNMLYNTYITYAIETAL